MRPRVLLLATLLVAGALAGCINDTPADPTGGNETDTGPSTNQENVPSPDDGRAYIAQAMDALAPANGHERLGMKLQLTQGGRDGAGLVMDIAFDNATREMRWTLQADAENPPESAAQARALGIDLEEGINVYVKGPVVALAMGRNVSVFPDTDQQYFPEDDRQPFFAVDAASDGPVNLERYLGVLADDDAVNVESVELVQHEGQPAARIRFNGTGPDGTAGAGVLVAYLQPAPFPAYLELETDPDGEGDATRVRIDFHQGDAVDLTVPVAVQRAMALVVQPDVQEPTATYTFLTPDGAGIDPGALRIQVKAHAFGFPGLGASGSDDEPLIDMPFSEGTRTEHNLTLTYTDADGDGLVSAGDTVTLENHDDETSAANFAVTFVDDETGTTVKTPTPGLAGLLLIGLTAAGLRRRR